MKNKTLIAIVWTSSIIFLLITFICYYLRFNSNGISSDPEQWAQFGDYFGGILNPFISLVNLFVLTYLSIRLVKVDNDRNAWTLQELARPYGELGLSIYSGNLTITVHNFGLGPMIITDILIKNSLGQVHNDFEKLVETNNNKVKVGIGTFKVSNNHCAVGKDGEIKLLILEGDYHDTIYMEYIKTIINKLKDYTLEVKYNDMYKRPMEPISEKIDFNESL